MVTGTVNVQSTNNLAQMKALVDKLSKMEVYVGIPEAEASREGDGVNNAQLLFLHTNGVHSISEQKDIKSKMDGGSTYSQAHQMFLMENGSDLYHIPPRPIIEPAIKKNQKMISKELGVAGKLILQGKESEAIQQLENVGEFASGKCREYFDDPDNGWPKNSPITIKKKGSDKPLIDTSELRKSLTFIISER